MERDYDYRKDSDFKEDAEFGTCSKCGKALYPEEILESHGCLGEERIVLIKCSCDEEPSPAYQEIALDNDMPF